VTHQPMILFETGPSGHGDVFASPLAMIVACEADQVAAALDEADAARRDGKWLAGFVSYEAGYALEPTLAALMPDRRRLPLICLGVFDGAVPAATLERRAGQLAQSAGLGEWRADWQRERYGQAFARVMQLIEAGDIYQANLTMRLSTELNGPALGLWGGLRQRQKVGHGAFVDLLPEAALLSRSPELFFRTDRTGGIVTRPMKGTAPRLADPEADGAQARRLQGDEKNRAENLMIVDLLRNDLGRVCRIGSIQVPELFKVETYATVHQMVSQVQGVLMPGVGLAGLFRALFPCGSVTGAPKIRAMQVIRDLEPQPREAYCGSIGWAAPDGRSSFSVGIRTLHLYAGGEVVLNAGGGIVADSRADEEYEEALWKTRFAQLPRPI
jgi:para-aminobenzoate synthetase component I